jgi:predicted CopG family antitoxin
VTEVKTIKISKETHAVLSEIAGELQMKLKRPVSLDEALRYLLKKRRLKPSDFAGAWNMTDEEEAEIFKRLREMWSRWKLPEM